MDLHRAVAQINAIHSQVSRSETFRGYRPLTVGCTGLLALLAAALQPLWMAQSQEPASAFLQLWVLVAAANVSLVGLELAVHAYRSPSYFARRQTWQAVEQFLPALVAGGALTWSLAVFAPDSLHLLPGLWGIVFSLGVFSAARQLPPATLIVGSYYLAAGVVAIAASRFYPFSPWFMAGIFGIGQFIAAGILARTLERKDG